MIDGYVKPGQRIKLMRSGREYVITEMGQFRPEPVKCDELSAGQVGYFTANIKNIDNVNIGDTVTDANNPTAEAMAGYKEPKPMVYSGLFPVNNNEFEDLREAARPAEAQRQQFHVPAGSLRRPRVRLPVRLPGDAPPRDHPAAARSGQQPQSGTDRA